MPVNIKDAETRSTRLRLEPGGDTPVQEYSIDKGKVEFRVVERESDPGSAEWHEVPPEELRWHVERGTVVAKWLERRLGWQRLLRQCFRNAAGMPKAA